MDWPDPLPEMSYIVGADLAQGGADWTALAVLQRLGMGVAAPPRYTVIWLERWRDRRTSRIPERLHAVYRRLITSFGERSYEALGEIPRTPVDIQLVVDQTGVGPFALDPLREQGFDPVGIVIHGGDAVSHPQSHTYRVPKRDLAGAVHTLLESDRLRIAGALPESSTLRAELENFRAKITLTGHDKYEAGAGEGWRVGSHDDLVLAVAVAAWLGEAHPTPVLDPYIVAAWSDLPRVR